MSEPNQMNVDVPVVLGAITQLSALSTSLNDLAGQLQDAGNLTWTGADETGVTLHDQLAPAEQGSVQAVAGTKRAVDGLVDSLGTLRLVGSRRGGRRGRRLGRRRWQPRREVVGGSPSPADGDLPG